MKKRERRNPLHSRYTVTAPGASSYANDTPRNGSGLIDPEIMEAGELEERSGELRPPEIHPGERVGILGDPLPERNHRIPILPDPRVQLVRTLAGRENIDAVISSLLDELEEIRVERSGPARRVGLRLVDGDQEEADPEKERP